MNSDFEARSTAALDALELGEPIESILQRFPEDADTLRPLLETAMDLQNLPLAYSISAQRASRQAMMREAARLRRQPAGVRVLPLLRRLSFALGAFALLVLASASLLARPAAGALPGEALYPLKRAGESLRLMLAADPNTLRVRYHQERRDELLRLLALGKEAKAECYGTILAFADDQWQVDDLTFRIDGDSVIVGEPAIGAPVEGSCLVRSGQLFARNVRITGPGNPLPEPPTPAPTATPERPTETPTPSPTATATNTPTATATPTFGSPDAITTLSAPLPPPVDDDDGEDNDDDGDHGDDEDGDDRDDSSSSGHGSGDEDDTRSSDDGRSDGARED